MVMRKFLFFIACAIILSITGCKQTQDPRLSAVSAAKGFVSYEVKFRPNADPNSSVLETFSNNNGCNVPPGKTRKGCLAFELDTFGLIKLSLMGQGNAGNQCDAGNPSVKWVITKVEGTTTPAANDEKGDFSGNALPNWALISFYPIKNPLTGILYEEALADATTSVTFLNLNPHLGDGVLWYRVTATNCTEQTDPQVTVKISDPRVENKGSN
jgi:hypothetical protein